MTTSQIAIESRPKAYAYSRISSAGQRGNASLAAQWKQAQEYAKAHGLELQDHVDRYEDEAISAASGRNVRSGALGRFLKDVEDGYIDKGSYLLISSLDRVSRESPRRCARIIETIVEDGINVVTLTDGKVYDEAALDDLGSFVYLVVVASRAFDEANRRRGYTQDARRRAWEAVRDGKQSYWSTGFPKWLQITDGKYRPLSDRQALIKELFSRFNSGEPLLAIAKDWNSRGINTWGYQKKRSLWRTSTLRGILQNDAVIGTLRVKLAGEDMPQIKRHFPKVIKVTEFNTAQRILATTQPRLKGKPTNNLLAGVLKCGLCRRSMSRVQKRGKFVYLECCGMKHGVCKASSIHYGYFTGALLKKLPKIVRGLPTVHDDVSKRLKKAQREVRELDAATIGVAEMLLAGESGVFRRHLDKLEVNLVKAKDELKDAEIAAAAANPVSVQRRLERLLSAPTNAVFRDTVKAIYATQMASDNYRLSIQFQHLVEPVMADLLWFRVVRGGFTGTG